MIFKVFYKGSERSKAPKEMATQGPQNQEKEHILISKTNNGTCVCP